MKQLFYSCLAICALLFASCADKDIVDNINGEDNQPGITVSMAMDGNMQADKPALTTRADPPNNAIGYETDDNTGFPTPVGIYNKGTNEGTELANGTKVPVLLIFKSTDTTQPVTKVITKWTYAKGGKFNARTNRNVRDEGGYRP